MSSDYPITFGSVVFFIFLSLTMYRCLLIPFYLFLFENTNKTSDSSSSPSKINDVELSSMAPNIIRRPSFHQFQLSDMPPAVILHMSPTNDLQQTTNYNRSASSSAEFGVVDRASLTRRMSLPHLTSSSSSYGSPVPTASTIPRRASMRRHPSVEYI
eukprot:PhF_6_TR39984/c0_g1_i2/m.59348